MARVVGRISFVAAARASRACPPKASPIAKPAVPIGAVEGRRDERVFTMKTEICGHQDASRKTRDEEADPNVEGAVGVRGLGSVLGGHTDEGQRGIVSEDEIRATSEILKENKNDAERAAIDQHTNNLIAGMKAAVSTIGDVATGQSLLEPKPKIRR